MFDENQMVEVKWVSGNKKYFENLGVPFTKIYDTFIVPAKMLMPHSRVKVKYTCDYCGKEYETTYNNLRVNLSRGKLCCKQCKNRKIAETLEEKYGSSSLNNCFEFQEKRKQVMIERYGAPYALQSKQGRENFKKSMLEKYGVDNPAKDSLLCYKSRITAYINGTVPMSKPEKEIVVMLCELYGKENCIPNFPVDRVNLDCLLILDDIKIDVEYDGKYWHRNTQDYDRKRNHWLISQGYKVLRILANSRDILPTKERLKQEIDYLLNGHSLGYIDMNNEMNI